MLAEVRRLLPSVLADARQVALDSRAMSGTLLGLANEIDTDPEGRFPGADRKDVAELLRWLADGNFVLLGYQRCPVHDGESTVDMSSRLGILRFRDEILPQLTDGDDLLVLAQATIPSFLRYGAYPYIVVVREHPGHQRDRASFRRAVHRGRHERQCDGYPVDLASGQRSDRDGAA